MMSKLVFSILAFLAVPMASGESTEKKDASAKIADSKKALSLIANQVAETKVQLVIDAKTQRKVLGSLYVLNKKLKDMAKKRNDLSNGVLSSEARVKSLARKIALQQEEIKGQTEHLSKRVRSLYMLNGQSLMRILFGSQSGHQFDKNLKYLRLLADRDYSLIQEYQRSLLSLQSKRTKLKKKVVGLVTAQKKLNKQKALLANQQESKSRLLKHIRSAKNHYLNQLKELRQRSKSLTDRNQVEELESALRPSFFEAKGHLPAPIHGQVTRGFGVIEDKKYGFHIAHKGLQYQAAPGEAVRAVFAGKVAFEGLLEGYGASVIVDHGDHYYTVYTNAVSSLVTRGEDIQSGQEIALATPEASQASRNLYFEIRHFSEAVDPGEWLQSTNFKQSQL